MSDEEQTIDLRASPGEREPVRIGASLPVREMAGDLGAIRDFAQAAEALGVTHLRIPDQVIRPDSGPLPEALTFLSYLAAITRRIELVPSVLILPLRQTALLARQCAQLDLLSEGRLRLGIGVGVNPAEYQAMGVDFATRGRRCDEQLALLQRLWTEPSVTFDGAFHQITDNGIDPRPAAPIPIWIGGRRVPGEAVVRRIGRWASGWFVLATPQEYPAVRARIDAAARAAGRDPESIGTEAGVAVVGPREHEWRDRITNWVQTGLTHLCLRTLGGGLAVAEHLPRLEAAMRDLPVPHA
ncbi:MAG: TIGR03619 family F420-dependent LLM class oxidoreductase [Pseudomonadota bacterium]